MYVDASIRKIADASIAQRVPGIKQLAKRYNTLCEELRRDPKVLQLHIPLPEAVDIGELFNVDANPALWRDDILLTGSDVTEDYMTSDAVKLGITALLARDRYLEEEARLRQELKIMVDWSSSIHSKAEDALKHCEGTYPKVSLYSSDSHVA